MITKQDGNNFVLVLKKGEKLVESLLGFAEQQSITATWVNGLGGVLGAEVGYYSLDTKDYNFIRLDNVLEVVSLNGNITLLNGKLFAHLHVVLSDENMKTYGGHLKEATVGGTCELYVKTIDAKLERQPDTETGLKLIS